MKTMTMFYIWGAVTIVAMFAGFGDGAVYSGFIITNAWLIAARFEGKR